MKIVFMKIIGTLLILFICLYVNTAVFNLKILSIFSIERRFMYVIGFSLLEAENNFFTHLF